MKIEVLKSVRLSGKTLEKGKSYTFKSKEDIKDAKYLCLIGSVIDVEEKK